VDIYIYIYRERERYTHYKNGKQSLKLEFEIMVKCLSIF
jgi:hypothetical protein